jgi:hypothetical protein
MITVRFMGQRCTLEWGQYASPRNPRLQLWTMEGPMATASINPEVPLPDGFIAIKDWRENAGVLAALVEANLCRILTRE